MVFTNSKVTIKSVEYNHILSDVPSLISYISSNERYFDSLNTMVTKYRQYNGRLMDYKFEIDHLHNTRGKNLIYSIITNDKDMLSMARCNRDGYINMVVTHEKYQGKGLCQGNLYQMINSVKIIDTFTLDVDIDNPAALRCYENVGFKRGKIWTDPKWGVKRYKMQLEI